MDGNAVANSAKQYIILKFDNEQYGIDITYIDNIVRLQKITRVPHAQPYFLGIINLRGEVVPVMSLRRKFELPDKENTNASRILILKVEGNAKIGILVDEVREVVTLTGRARHEAAATIFFTTVPLPTPENPEITIKEPFFAIIYLVPPTLYSVSVHEPSRSLSSGRFPYRK